MPTVETVQGAVAEDQQEFLALMKETYGDGYADKVRGAMQQNASLQIK